MPSFGHEALLLLFRNRPELVIELLRDVLGVELPPYREVRSESVELSDAIPAEYRADQVAVLHSGSGRPALAIVVEVQLRVDQRKRWSWPVYVATLRARWRCPALVFVVAPRRSVASWASKPIELGPGSVVRPIAMAAEAVPRVTDAERARRAPELVVLSAMAHGQGDVTTAVAIARAGAEACAGHAEGVVYWDLIESSLSLAARRALEAEMASTEGYKFRSKFLRESQAKGRADGKAEGLAVGKAEGLAVGKAEGLAVGKAEDVLAVLEARGLAVADEQRERISSCRDLALLDRWLRRAVTVDRSDALFE